MDKVSVERLGHGMVRSWVGAESSHVVGAVTCSNISNSPLLTVRCLKQTI